MIGMDLSLCLLSNSCLCTDHIWVFSTSFKYLTSQVREELYVLLLCILLCAIWGGFEALTSDSIVLYKFYLKYNGKNIANIMWTPSPQSLVHRAMYLQLSSRCWYQIYPLQSSHPAVLQTDFSNYTCIMKIGAKCKHFAFSFSKLEDAIISLW